MKVIKDLRKRAVLEVVDKDEEGVGLGPTLEFYSKLGDELRADDTLWRKNTNEGSLYPKGLQITFDN